MRIVIALFALLAVVGCSSSTGDSTGTTNDSSGSSGSSTDKYTQTWSKSYAATTCTDWSSQMTSAQQWAAAADMLTGARNSGDGGTGLPSDALITEFQSGVTTACVEPTMSLTDVGAGLYLTERDRFRP